MTDLVYPGNEEAVKYQVTATSTGNITLSGEQTIDGISVVSGQRVLVRAQSAGAENGIWVAHTSGWIRADDYTFKQVKTRTKVFVQSGTYAGTEWEVTNSGTIVVGQTSLTYSLVTSPITLIGTEETDPDGTENFAIEDAGTKKYISISNADEGMIISSTADPTANDDSAGTAGNGECHVGRRWVNTVSNSAFISVDASTGGAVWNEIPYNTYNKTASPSSNDDASGTAGNGTFSVGSVWIDLTDNVEWVCVDDTAAAAIWNRRVYDYTSTASPTTNDDDANTGGNGVFQLGSKWIDSTKNSVYVLTDPSSGAAIWNELPYSSYSNATDPTTNDDSVGTGGSNPFAVGSRWINTNDDKVFTAVDVSSGAAVWRESLHTGAETLSTSGSFNDTARTHWLASTAAGASLTLPSPSVRSGDEHVLTCLSSAFAWTVTGEIQGSTAGTEVIYPGESFSLKSDGSYWRISG